MNLGKRIIRPATREDVPAIKDLMRSEPGFWENSWRPDVLERAMDCADSLAFVWEEAGQILGFICGHDFGCRAYLSVLIVSTQVQSREIGKRLVSWMEDRLRQRGCKTLIADVWKNAVGFYRSLGWSEPDVVLLRKTI